MGAWADLKSQIDLERIQWVKQFPQAYRYQNLLQQAVVLLNDISKIVPEEYIKTMIDDFRAGIGTSDLLVSDYDVRTVDRKIVRLKQDLQRVRSSLEKAADDEDDSKTTLLQLLAGLEAQCTKEA